MDDTMRRKRERHYQNILFSNISRHLPLYHRFTPIFCAFFLNFWPPTYHILIGNVIYGRPKERKKGKALSKHHLVPGVLTTWGHQGPHQSSLTRQTTQTDQRGASAQWSKTIYGFASQTFYFYAISLLPLKVAGVGNFFLPFGLN